MNMTGKKIIVVKVDSCHNWDCELHGSPFLVNNQVMQCIIIDNRVFNDKILDLIYNNYGNRVHKDDFVKLLVKNGYKKATISQYLKLSNKSGWLNKMIEAGVIEYQNNIIFIKSEVKE